MKFVTPSQLAMMDPVGGILLQRGQPIQSYKHDIFGQTFTMMPIDALPSLGVFLAI